MKADHWQNVDKGRVIGRFDLTLDSGMVIRGATLVDGEKGRFVSLPQRSWENRSGKTIYENVIEFNSKERADAFFSRALAAVEELRKQ